MSAGVEYHRAWRASHPDSVRRSKAKYRREHPDRVKADSVYPVEAAKGRGRKQ